MWTIRFTFLRARIACGYFSFHNVSAEPVRVLIVIVESTSTPWVTGGT